MPMQVVCPECSAKLTVPDSAAGKRIKCPKCQTLLELPPAEPDFEVVDEAETKLQPKFEEPPRPKPRQTNKPASKPTLLEVDDDEDDERPQPKKKPRREEDDEDDEVRPQPKKKARRDDSDEDDRPSPKKRKKQEKTKPAKSVPLPLLIGGIAVLVLGIGFATYWFGFRNKGGAGGGGDTGGGAIAKPENWQPYTSPDNAFKASFPGEPQGKPANVVGYKVTGNVAKSQSGSKRLGDASLEFYAGCIRFPEGTSDNDIKTARKWLITDYAAPMMFGGGEYTGKQVTVGNRTWNEGTYPAGKSKGLMRYLVVGSTLYLVGYRAENQPAPDEAFEQFFASFEILAGQPADPNPDPIPVSLDNWQEYTSPKNVFKASFPGESKAKTDYSFKSVAAEFREFTLKDDKTRATKSFIVGYAQFAGDANMQVEQVRKYLSQEVFGEDRVYARKLVSVGGWPWGEEARATPKTFSGVTSSGVTRMVIAGKTVFALGIKYPAEKMPSQEEQDKFFGSFEIVTKPDAKALAMPQTWYEHELSVSGRYRSPPLSFKSDLQLYNGGSYAGVNIKGLHELRTGYFGTHIHLNIAYFDSNTPEADRRKVMEALAQRKSGTNPAAQAIPGEKLRWGGREGLEHTLTKATTIDGRTYSSGVIRECIDGNIGIVAMILSESEPVDPVLVKAYLDSFSFEGPIKKKKTK